MHGRVEAERQMQHMVEIVRHDGQPAAMGQPVRVQGDKHRRSDGEQAERHPGPQERCEFGPAQRVIFRLSAGQDIDDAAEQDRLGKLGDGQGQIGEDENDRQAPLGAELLQHPQIDLQKLHEPAAAMPDRAPCPGLTVGDLYGRPLAPPRAGPGLPPKR